MPPLPLGSLDRANLAHTMVEPNNLPLPPRFSVELEGVCWDIHRYVRLTRRPGLAWVLSLVEDTGVWPDGLLAAYITMIPKTDGDSTL